MLSHLRIKKHISFATSDKNYTIIPTPPSCVSYVQYSDSNKVLNLLGSIDPSSNPASPTLGSALRFGLGTGNMK